SVARRGVAGKGRPPPLLITSTILPSARIFAVVVVLLMSFCPSGRDDPDPLATLHVGHMQDHALAHASQVDAFLALVLAIIEPLDGETIAERFDRITKGDD